MDVPEDWLGAETGPRPSGKVIAKGISLAIRA